jgi:hypothetical protein
MFMESPAAALRAHEFVLSNLSPSVAQRRFALGVVLVLLVVFVIVTGAPSGLPLRRVDAFIPAYGTAILVIDSIRSPALRAVFHPTLACAPRTREWLFPDGAHRNSLDAHISRRVGGGGRPWRRPPEYGLALCPVARGLRPVRDRLYPAEGCRSDGVAVARLHSCEDHYECRISYCTRLLRNSFVTAGHALLPRIMLDTAQVSYIWYYAVGPMAGLFVVALVLLWLRHRSVLDLWLMLVLFAYIIEIALTAFPIPYRFSVGWYAGRVYGVLSGSLVLLILMKEVTMLYGELLRAVLAQRREREVRLLTGDAVAATVAHEIKQPLSAMTMDASASLRWLDRATPNIDAAKVSLQQIVNNGHRAGAVIENIRRLFKTEARTRSSLEVNNLISEALALVRDDLRRHRVAVQTTTTNRSHR